ncbi:MAG TPA: hypothetical protein VF631_05195 [Allosphingosinicella sp.]|jgi:hypothetical protein|uniref:hypothetical protein n=1 Tax=Allosphingosinicella sp. TaxID=2823234 RepID=UPI002F2A3E86
MGVSRVKPSMLKITVRFQEREDGGLRAWSDDVPGFVLSHPDAEAVLEDVEPALETMLSAMYGVRVMVAPLLERNAYEQQPCLPIVPNVPPAHREYASQLCAA